MEYQLNNIEQISKERGNKVINPKDKLIKNSYLFLAIRENNIQEEKIKRVKKYLDEGADINYIDKNDSDNTCLHVAVLENDPEIVRLLLERGAAIDTKNADGKTAYDFAEQLQNLSIIEIFHNIFVSSEIVSQQERNKNISKKNEAENKYGVEVTKILKQNKKQSRKRYRKQGLHGDIYQLKLLMLFLKRGLDAGFCFRLATEKKEARKFDDLIFEYINKDSKKEYRLLQAKHKEDELKKITFYDLLTESDTDYSLVKYYFSYMESKHDAFFKEGIIKDVTVCTNINFDLNSKKMCDLEEIKLRDTIQELEKNDYILDVIEEKSKNGPVRYRFGKNIVPLLKPALNSYSLTMLAKRLAICFLKNIRIQCNKKDVFKQYHTALAKEVINVDKKEFFFDFVNGSNTLSTEAKRFREIFKAELERQPEGMSLENVNAAIVASKVSFNLSSGFGNAQRKQNFIYNDQTSELAKILIKCILNSQTVNKGGIFKFYHVALAESFIDVNNGMFRDEFINGKEIPEDFKKFRNDLEKESQLQGNLSLEKINQVVKDNRSKERVGLNLSEGFGKGGSNNWPNDVISDEDINDFINHLVFAVNQPNEEKLGEIIEKELSKVFNFSEKKYVYNELFVKMLDWLKGKGDDFISYEDGRRFLDDVRTKLCELELTCMTLNYKCEMKEYNINFNLDTTQNLKIREFLTSKSPHKNFLSIYTKHSTLSSIKLYQTVDRIVEFEKDNSFIFMKLDSAHHLQDHVIRAFSGNCNILIINCVISKTYTARDTEKLYSSLFDIINRSNNKKIVLITYENDFFAKEFKNAFSVRNEYEELIDNSLYFQDLTTESRKILLEKKKIMFQGKEVNLCNVINDDTQFLIDNEILSKIICNERVEVGKLPYDFSEVKRFYVHRKLMISNFSEAETKDAEVMQLIFKPSNISYSMNNCNSMNNLPSETKIGRELKDDLEFKDINDRIVILADEPGSGKSTFMYYIAEQLKESDNSLWVEVIPLNHHYKTLHEAELDNRDNVIKYILDVLNLNKNLEKELFKHRVYKEGKIILLFDGFDEISPDYKKNVIALLKILKDTKIEKLWITTRPHMSKILTDELNENSYALMPLSSETQQEFLMNYFSYSCKTASEENLKFFTDKLMDLVSRSIVDYSRNFIGVPLHLRMLAEVYESDFKEFCDLSRKSVDLPIKMDLTDLYSEFIKKKYDIYFTEKHKVDLTNLCAKDSYKKLYLRFMHEHKLASAIALFQSEDIKLLISEEELKEVKDFIRTVKEGNERTGIISYVIDDRPRFIHQTYAEYFAAELISDKIKLYPSNENIWTLLINTVFLKNYPNIRKFFEYKLIKDIDLKELSSKSSFREIVSKLIIHKTSGCALCVAAKENLVNVTLYFLKGFEGNSHKSTDSIPRIFYHAILYLLDYNEDNAEKVLSNHEKSFQDEILYKGNNSNYYVLPSYLEVKEKHLRIFDIFLQSIVNSGNIELIIILLHLFLTIVRESPRYCGIFRYPIMNKFSSIFKSISQLLKNLESRDRKIIVNAKFKSGESLIHLACLAEVKCKPNNLGFLETFLRAGADINAQNDDGVTCLHISAVLHDAYAVMQFLVDNGANINIAHKYGDTPLHSAALTGNLKGLKYLIQKEADIKAINKSAQTALHLAVQNRNLQTYLNFVTVGMDLAIPYDMQYVYFKAHQETLEMVRYLVEKGSDINAVDCKGKNAVYLAVDIVLHKIKNNQVDNKCNLACLNTSIITSNEWSIQSDVLVALKYLLKKGAEMETTDNIDISDINATDVNHTSGDVQNVVEGFTPHFPALPQSSTLEMVQYLVENGADLKAVDTHGRSVLHLASMYCTSGFV